MAGIKRGPVGDLSLVAGWLALLWVIFVVDVVLRMADVWLAGWFGLFPRRTDGLLGILTAHLLHANVTHIAMNSLGLLILGWISCRYSRRLTLYAVMFSMLCAGSLTWVIGSLGQPPAVHIGASGVVFGLIGWLMANGIFRRDWRAVIMTLVVVVLYGGALTGAMPSKDASMAQISWEMHLGGFIGGILASWNLRKAKV
jgi:membrane associated rhomboid family serine protease